MQADTKAEQAFYRTEHDKWRCNCFIVFRLIGQYLIVRRVNIINRVISSHAELITRVLECRLRPSIFWMAIPIYETIRLGLEDRIGFPSIPPTPPPPLFEQFVNLPTPALAIVMEQQLVAIKSSLKLNEKIFYQRNLITQSGIFRRRNKFYNSSWNQ